MVDKLTARRKRVDLNLDELIGVTSRFSLYDPPAGFRSPSGGFSPSGALNFRLGKRGGRTASRPGLTKQAERDLDTTMRQPGVREPRGKDPKAREPRAKEPRTGEPRAKEPRTGEPRAKEPKVRELGAGSEPVATEARMRSPRRRTVESHARSPSRTQPASTSQPPSRTQPPRSRSQRPRSSRLRGRERNRSADPSAGRANSTTTAHSATRACSVTRTSILRPGSGPGSGSDPRCRDGVFDPLQDLESRQDSEKQSPLEMVFALRRTQSLKQACAKFVAERQAEGESRESSPHALSLRLLFTTASRSGTPRALIHIRRLLLGETVRPELVLQEATALLRHAAGNAEHLWDLTSIVLCFADAPPTTFIKHYLRQLHSIL